MLTIEGLIAVISLCLTCFGLGYTIGCHKTAPWCKLSYKYLQTGNIQIHN